MQVKIIIWACFIEDRLNSLIICNEKGIGVNEYEDILYNELFSFIDNILQPTESDIIYIADESTFLFMQNNASCYKAECILKFLAENNIPIMK